MSSLTSAEAVIEAALALRGADRMVVIVHDGSDAEVRFANNSVTTNGVRRTRTTTVIVIVERDGGSAAGAATRTGNVDVADLVVAARFEAQSAPLSSDAFELVAPVVDGDVGAPAAMNDLSVLDPVLGSLAGVISRAAERDVTLAGFAEHQLQTTTIGTSTGLRRRHVQPTGAFTLVGRADGGRRSAWLGAGTADFSDIDLATFEESLHRRLEWSRQSFELPAGRYETLMPSSAVADMMAYAYWMAQGQDSEDGRTVFSKAGGGTRVGDTLSALPFTLRSNPAEVGIESTPFVVASASSGSTSVYDNGLALAPTSWIENGRVATLQYHRAGAQRSAVAATAAIDNLVLELPGATGSLDDMIVSTERDCC
jgi:predicted Zn-dependent protease